MTITPEAKSFRSRLKQGVVVFILGLGIGLLLASSFLKPPVRVEYQDRVKVQEKVVTKEVVEWKDRIVEVKVKDTKMKVVTKIVEVEKPGGEKVKTTEITETAATDEKKNLDVVKEGTKAAERVVDRIVYRDVVVKQTPVLSNWMVTGAIGAKISLPPSIVYGGMVQRRIIGPFWIGAWGTTNPDVGLSLSVEF